MAAPAAHAQPAASAPGPSSSAPAPSTSAPVVPDPPAFPVGVPPLVPAPAASPHASPPAAATAAAHAAPAASATAAAHAAPAGSAHAVAGGGHGESAPDATGSPVRIHDRRVFNVLVGRAGSTAEQRASAAGQALERSAEETEEGEVRTVEQGDVLVVFAGAVPIIQLGPEDAAAAGDATLLLHATGVEGKVRDALRAERQRSAIANRVFSFSLVVFSGLVAFLLVRKLAELIERFRTWMDGHPDRLPAVRVRGIEVVAPAAVRGGVSVALTMTSWLAQVGIVYGWVIIAFSLFESTRSYTERLTGFVLTPISALMGRVASALPLLVIAAVTAFATFGALRFVRLFFGSVARGETTLGWLPRDLAPATSILVRFGIVVVTLVIAAPLITGTDDGAISRVGAVALGALGLATTPLLGTAATGIVVMFGGRLRVGEHVVVGGRAGRVRATTLLEVQLEDDEGCDVHVPHLVCLWHPTRILGLTPPVCIEVAVAATSDLQTALEALEQAATTVGTRPRVVLVSLGVDGALYRITVQAGAPAAVKSALLRAVATSLHERGIALGRSPA